MADTGGRRSAPHRKNSDLRWPWCYPFGPTPHSPDCRSSTHYQHNPSKPLQKPPSPPYSGSSFHSSPSPSSKLGLNIIDPRPILSPGQVSLIDSDTLLGPLPMITNSTSIATMVVGSEPESSDPLSKERALVPERPAAEDGACLREGSLDLMLSLKGKGERCLVLELDLEALCENSIFFASMVLNSGQKVSEALADCRKIEVTDVEDLGAFRETIELMYEKDAMRRLMKVGVARAIDILEVRMA